MKKIKRKKLMTQKKTKRTPAKTNKTLKKVNTFPKVLHMIPWLIRRKTHGGGESGRIGMLLSSLFLF